MSFRLVPKSVILNELERRNGHYFALFHRILIRCRRNTVKLGSRFNRRRRWPLHLRCRRKKFMFVISSPDEFLLYLYSIWILRAITRVSEIPRR